MTKEIIKTKVDLLPRDKTDTVGKFIDFILRKSQEENKTEQLIKLQAESGAFNFLISEPDIYSDKNSRKISMKN